MLLSDIQKSAYSTEKTDGLESSFDCVETCGKDAVQNIKNKKKCCKQSSTYINHS